MQRHSIRTAICIECVKRIRIRRGLRQACISVPQLEFYNLLTQHSGLGRHSLAGGGVSLGSGGVGLHHSGYLGVAPLNLLDGAALLS